MINASSLRAITEKANADYGEKFWKEYQTYLFEKMEAQAKSGQYEYSIGQADDMNKMGFLSVPHLYKVVIEELKGRGFIVHHSDNISDGTYLTIKWY